MKIGRLAVFLGALAAAGAAVWLVGLEREESGTELLFPELTLEELNAVNRVEIIEHGSSPVSVYLSDDGEWLVADHHDHPADTVKVRQLLSEIKDAEKIERKTSLPEHYATLGVADPRNDGASGGQGDGQSDGKGVLLSLKTPDATRALIVGSPSRQMSEGRYVRKPDEAESWLVNVALQLPVAASEWLDVEILHLEPDQVSTIKLTPAEGGTTETLTVVRDKNKRLTVADVPEGKALKDQYKLRQIAAVTDYLKFKNVFPRESDELDLPDERVTASFETKDGLTVTIEAYKDGGGKVYLELDAAGAGGRAEDLKRRFSRWTYEVSSTIYKGLDRRPDDFLKDAS